MPATIKPPKTDKPNPNARKLIYPTIKFSLNAIAITNV
jgi:hypothetical protein